MLIHFAIRNYWYAAIGLQLKKICFREYMKNTDLKAIFKKVVVDEITKKQEGLTRFINQMRYQITKAEEKWANLYYDFLRGILKFLSMYIPLCFI